MDTSNTTRRGLLRLATGTLAYGAGAAAVTGAGFAISEAKGATPAVDRHAWDETMRRYQIATAEEAAFDRDYRDPAYKAYKAALDALPHVQATGVPDGLRVPDTSDWRSLDLARTLTHRGNGQPRAVVNEYDHLHNECLRVLAAAEQRDAEDQRLRERFRYDEYAERSEELGEVSSDLMWELMALPAPDTAALAWKLERLLDDGGSGTTPAWDASFALPTIADMRRLLTQEG
ncbi:MAG TPA: hypothetical protein VF592_05800 [Sphingomonas sp.]|uniref:hypothetical protein n=1 Tax=Sphingomonas sp. TaxID=28214 RepID=UPI002ED89D3D